MSDSERLRLLTDRILTAYGEAGQVPDNGGSVPRVKEAAFELKNAALDALHWIEHLLQEQRRRAP